jgi:hypothetical protein
MTGRRRALWVAVGVLVVAGSAALVATLTSKSADRLVASVAVLDFGTIPKGDVESKVFRLRNESERPVTIGMILGNCACIVVKQSYGHRLLPGEETDVHVDVDSNLTPAVVLQGKLVSVPSDDPAGLLKIPLKAQVLELVRLTPEALAFGPIPTGTTERPSRPLSIRGGPGFRVRVLRADVSPADVFELQRTDVEGGADFVVTVKPGATGTGRPKGGVHLTLETSGERIGLRRGNRVVPIHLDWQ